MRSFSKVEMSVRYFGKLAMYFAQPEAKRVWSTGTASSEESMAKACLPRDKAAREVVPFFFFC